MLHLGKILASFLKYFCFHCGIVLMWRESKRGMVSRLVLAKPDFNLSSFPMWPFPQKYLKVSHVFDNNFFAFPGGF